MIEAARWAPSPDNNQPWAFTRSGDAVEVLHVRSRAIASDARDMFSWLGVGAAVENVTLAASARRLVARVRYHDRPFAKLAGEEHVATIELQPGGAVDPLHEQIERRCTSRQPYQRRAIAPERLEKVAAAAGAAVAVAWLSEREQIKQAAGLIREADRIRFEHQPFHEELHAVLRYSQQQAEQAGDGMSLKALEIPAAMGPVLRFLRPWRRARAMNRIGLSRVFAGMAGQQIISSGAIGLLTTDDATDAGYMEAGRSLQRVWLAATAEGLSMQPLGSVPLFLTRLRDDRASFQPRHAERLDAVDEAFGALFEGLKERSPVMLFRIGEGRPPSARSPRYPAEAIMR